MIDGGDVHAVFTYLIDLDIAFTSILSELKRATRQSKRPRFKKTSWTPPCSVTVDSCAYEIAVMKIAKNVRKNLFEYIRMEG